MSRYLQRLVLGVMRPVESIHPLVGSVYSPVHYGKYSREENNEGAIPPQPDRKPSLERIPVTARQQILSVAQINEEVVDREEVPSSGIFADRQTPSPASQPAPLTAESSSGTVGVEHSNSANRAAHLEHGTSSRFVSPSETPAEERRLTMKPRYLPMLPTDVAATLPADADKTTANAMVFPSPVAQEDNNGLPRPAALVERNRDEVQIHIGRIEVTALLPAAMRPAPPSLRKGLNLEDYLKRSDRRWR